MKIIYNNIIPVKGFTAINIFGVVFARKGKVVGQKTINHESIHTAQIKELLYIFFYLLYIIEWLIKLIKYRKQAYTNISFEREAYGNDRNADYLKQRKRYAWIKNI
ncbi:MAG: hypothetical protein LBQ73_02295 [Tannerellaceae bacterium]|jgi:hypothetical protein|nr:hypothetical protein [Tannerellaceae bacterium]